MKKYLCILLLALLFSLGTLAGGHLWVNGARERMDIRETVITGDPAAAAGLAVTYRTRDQENHLLWETTYTPGGAERAETDFRFSAEGEQRSYYGRDIVSLPAGSAFPRKMSGITTTIYCCCPHGMWRPARLSERSGRKLCAWRITTNTIPSPLTS